MEISTTPGDAGTAWHCPHHYAEERERSEEARRLKNKQARKEREQRLVREKEILIDILSKMRVEAAFWIAGAADHAANGFYAADVLPHQQGYATQYSKESLKKPARAQISLVLAHFVHVPELFCSRSTIP